MMMKRIRIFSLLIIISFFGFSSCKNIESEPKEAVKELSQTKVFESNPEDTVVQITLNTNDKLRYDIGEINVYEGHTIQLTLHHNGTMPATAMGHNFVLKDNDISLYDFGEKAMRSVHTEYLPEENVMVGTSIIGGGESTTIEFNAPRSEEHTSELQSRGHL